jgi:hypothetical protein
MKNIFVLPTDQPSRLFTTHRLVFDNINPPMNCKKAVHIYITSSEEIKEGDYCVDGNDIYGPYEDGDIATDKFIKIILTTDSQLIRYGVQAIDDEFLEWFIKNPTCEFIKVTKLDYLTNRQYRIYNLPQEEPKQEKEEEYFKHLEKDKKEFAKEWEEIRQEFGFGKQETLEELKSFSDFSDKFFGTTEKEESKQTEIMYSEQEVLDLLYKRDLYLFNRDETKELELPTEWFEQFKKK